MLDVVLYIATSLDGYIARANGDIDWLPDDPETCADLGYQEFYDSIDALVMGTKTYQQVLGFGPWPYQGKPTYVFSHSLPEGQDKHIEILRCDVEQAIERLSRAGYRRVWLVGGAALIKSFMQLGQIQEMIISIIPHILGEGIPLFQSPGELPLRLQKCQAFSAGIVSLYYKI